MLERQFYSAFLDSTPAEKLLSFLAEAITAVAHEEAASDRLAAAAARASLVDGEAEALGRFLARVAPPKPQTSHSGLASRATLTDTGPSRALARKLEEYESAIAGLEAELEAERRARAQATRAAEKLQSEAAVLETRLAELERRVSVAGDEATAAANRRLAVAAEEAAALRARAEAAEVRSKAAEEAVAEGARRLAEATAEAEKAIAEATRLRRVDVERAELEVRLILADAAAASAENRALAGVAECEGLRAMVMRAREAGAREVAELRAKLETSESEIKTLKDQNQLLADAARSKGPEADPHLLTAGQEISGLSGEGLGLLQGVAGFPYQFSSTPLTLPIPPVPQAAQIDENFLSSFETLQSEVEALRASHARETLCLRSTVDHLKAELRDRSSATLSSFHLNSSREISAFRKSTPLSSEEANRIFKLETENRKLKTDAKILRNRLARTDVSSIENAAIIYSAAVQYALSPCTTDTPT